MKTRIYVMCNSEKCELWDEEQTWRATILKRDLERAVEIIREAAKSMGIEVEIVYIHDNRAHNKQLGRIED